MTGTMRAARPSSACATRTAGASARRSGVRFSILIALASVLAALCGVATIGSTPAAATEVPESERGAIAQRADTDFLGNVVGFEVYADDPPGPLATSADVRLSATPMRSTRMAAWTYPARTQMVPMTYGMTRSPISTTVKRGWIVCASARPHYADGVTGRWGSPFCTGRYLDDRSLHRAGHVKTVNNPKFWGGHASVVYGGDSSLALRHVPKGSWVEALTTAVACRPHDDCRGTELFIPFAEGRHSLMALSRPGDPTLHSIETDFGTRTERRGSLVFRSSSSAGPSNPIEGILVYPPWARP